MDEAVICIICPLGCGARISTDEAGRVSDVIGCRCEEGRDYVLEEYRNPARVLTLTVLTRDSSRRLLPARTNKPIPRSLLLDAARFLSQVRVGQPIRSGEVIVPGLLGTDADLIATDDLLPCDEPQPNPCVNGGPLR